MTLVKPTPMRSALVKSRIVTSRLARQHRLSARALTWSRHSRATLKRHRLPLCNHSISSCCSCRSNCIIYNSSWISSFNCSHSNHRYHSNHSNHSNHSTLPSYSSRSIPSSRSILPSYSSRNNHRNQSDRSIHGSNHENHGSSK